MASVLYPFDPNMRAVALQFSCRFEGNNARVANDDQGRDIDCVHQRAIFGIGRHEYVKRTDPGLKSRASQELDDLRRTSRVSQPQLRRHVALILAEQSTMLLGDVAVAHIALPLRAQECRITQDDTARGLGSQSEE